MVIQSSITGSASTTFRPSFPQSQRFLDTRRLQIPQNGQGYSISFPRQILPSARPRSACLNTTCAATQTQRQPVKGTLSTIPIAPFKENQKTPRLDKGDNGFPPRGGGGGGGGGGGNGGNSSGGFYLFSLLIFFDYLKELEGNESQSDRRSEHHDDRRFL